MLDLVRDQFADGLDARPSQPQIEQIAHQVAQKLLPFFAQESRDLDSATRHALVLAVVQTLATRELDADRHLQVLTSLRSISLRNTRVKDTSALDHLLGLDIEL